MFYFYLTCCPPTSFGCIRGEDAETSELPSLITAPLFSAACSNVPVLLTWGTDCSGKPPSVATGRIGLGVGCMMVEIGGLLDGCCGIALRMLTMVGRDDKDEEVRAENVNEPMERGTKKKFIYRYRRRNCLGTDLK